MAGTRFLDVVRDRCVGVMNVFAVCLCIVITFVMKKDSKGSKIVIF